MLTPRPVGRFRMAKLLLLREPVDDDCQRSVLLDDINQKPAVLRHGVLAPPVMMFVGVATVKSGVTGPAWNWPAVSTEAAIIFESADKKNSSLPSRRRTGCEPPSFDIWNVAPGCGNARTSTPCGWYTCALFLDCFVSPQLPGAVGNSRIPVSRSALFGRNEVDGAAAKTDRDNQQPSIRLSVDGVPHGGSQICSCDDIAVAAQQRDALITKNIRTFPRSRLRISMSAAGTPAFRVSNTGTPVQRHAAGRIMGLNGTAVTLNGITDGEWVWMTAFTSCLTL